MTSVRAVGDGERVDALDLTVVSEAGEEHHRTRQLVVATGGTPKLPGGLAMSGDTRVLHAHALLSRLRDACPDPDGAYSVVIVGAGQSAADALYHVLLRYPQTHVTLVCRQASFRLLDDNPFVNELFHPEWTETFSNLPPSLRARVLEEHRSAAYSIVDRRLLERIYYLLYEERARGRDRTRFVPLHTVSELRSTPEAVEVELARVDGQTTSVVAGDAVVCATGYDRRPYLPLLSEVDEHFERERDGSYAIDRDYSVRTDAAFVPRIRLLGFAERTHGFADPHLSAMAHRAARVRDDVLRELRRTPALA